MIRHALRDLHAEAIRLRTTDRLSASEITRELNGKVNRSTVIRWLREHPLTGEEREAKQRASAVAQAWCVSETQSKFHALVQDERLSGHRKARVAEAAIAFRCALLGFSVFSSDFEGEACDKVIRTPYSDTLVTLQIKWCGRLGVGAPVISLVRTNGRGVQRRYGPGDFDLLVGYDLTSDTAYIFSWDEVKHLKRRVSVRPDAAEAWHKVKAITGGS